MWLSFLITNNSILLEKNECTDYKENKPHEKETSTDYLLPTGGFFGVFFLPFFFSSHPFLLADSFLSNVTYVFLSAITFVILMILYYWTKLFSFNGNLLLCGVKCSS